MNIFNCDGCERRRQWIKKQYERSLSRLERSLQRLTKSPQRTSKTQHHASGATESQRRDD